MRAGSAARVRQARRLGGDLWRHGDPGSRHSIDGDVTGQGGGYISAAAPGIARGASWELTTISYRNVACGDTTVLTGAAANDGGHLVSSLFYDGPGQLSTDFLYRDAVPGRPELNASNPCRALIASLWKQSGLAS